MYVIVNAASGGGRAAEKWTRVERALRERGVAFEAHLSRSAEEGNDLLSEAIRGRHAVVVAAGGDGTVNGLVNALLDPATDRPRADVAVGAIGLGSSNDFHKPFSPGSSISGVPIRIARESAAEVDVGKAVLVDPEGRTSTRYFVLNGSLGFVAEGNAYFNGPDPVLGWFKRRHTEAAILYTALVNLFRFRPIGLHLRLDGGEPCHATVSSLAVLKKVHFAGGMRYDTPVTPDDGTFDVALWGRMGQGRILLTMAGLYAGRFRGRPRTAYRRAARVELEPERPASLELDGEVTRVVRAELVVLPRRLRICG